ERALAILAPGDHATEIEAKVASSRSAGLKRGRRIGTGRWNTANGRVVRNVPVLGRIPRKRDSDAGPVEELEARIAVDRELILDCGVTRAVKRELIARHRFGSERIQLIADPQLTEENRSLVRHRSEQDE